MDDDGYIYIVDRFKDMIVSGGENVYSGEVESAISSHPAVAACAVIGIPCVQWGEAVHAVIVLKPDHEAAGAAIIEHCRRQIAGYKTPKSVEFRTALPLSGAGKVLKRDLREPFWAGKDRGVS
jgi:long-chain acyl-CoA synthetase